MNKSGFIIVKQGQNQVGLKDQNGNEVLPCVYDKILDYDEDGYIRFIKDDVYGTLNFEGKVCIPLSLGIMHLGVFHQGTARARKGDSWGLINPKGENIGSFDYLRIDAYIYHLQAYKAWDAQGTEGLLYPNGAFKSNKKKELPKCHATLSYSCYDVEHIKYLIKCSTGDFFHPVCFYYRDTDVSIPVKKLYKKGRLIRNDRFLIADEKLMKPIHKLRFLILSRGFYSESEYERRFSSRERYSINEDSCEGSVYKGVVIPPNTYFIVKDVVTYAGITQVLLLHVPYHGVILAEKLGLKISSLKTKTADFVPIGKAALVDLQCKTSKVVHGHSLSPLWCEKMKHPLGCNDQYTLNSLDPIPLANFSDKEVEFIEYTNQQNGDDDFAWRDENIKVALANHVYIYSGDISQIKAEAIVWPTDKDLGDSLSRFKRVIRMVVPNWKAHDKDVSKELTKCYYMALEIAAKDNLKSIVFPLLGTAEFGFPEKIAAQIACTAIQNLMEIGKCKSDIYICCSHKDEVQSLLSVTKEAKTLKIVI